MKPLDPLDIELKIREYIRFANDCRYPDSVLLRLSALVESIPHDDLGAYLSEMISVTAAGLPRMRTIGTGHPAAFQSLHWRLLSFRDNHGSTADLDQVIEYLRLTIARRTAFVSHEGESVMPRYAFSRTREQGPPPSDTRRPANPYLSFRRSLHKSNDEACVVYTPMIVYDSSSGVGADGAPGLAAWVRVQTSSVRGQDCFSGSSYGAEDEFERGARIALEATRKWIRSSATPEEVSLSGLEISVSESSWDSSPTCGLAVALAAGVVLRNRIKSTVVWSVKRDVGVTGAVERNGNVLALDPSKVKHLTDSVFFSAVKTWVVPEDSRAIVLSRLKELSETWPERELTVLGVQSVSSLFDDRRIVKWTVRSRRERLLEHVNRIPVVFFSVLIFVLALGAVWLEYGPIDQTYQHHSINGQWLVFKNRFGVTIDKVNLNRNISEKISDADLMRYKLFDISNTSFADNPTICWINRHANTGQNILCRRLGEAIADTIRVDEVAITTQYPNQPWGNVRRVEHIFEIALIPVADGQKEALFYWGSSGALGHSFVRRVNLDTGVIEAEYTHPGRFSTILPVKWSDDRWYIVITAVNNDLRRAGVIILLDPDFLQGHGPARKYYQPLGARPGTERRYIQFGKEVLGDRLLQNQFTQEPTKVMLGDLRKANAAFTTAFRGKPGADELKVSLLIVRSAENPMAELDRDSSQEEISEFVFLDRDFNVVRFEPVNHYRESFSKMYQKGWLDETLREHGIPDTLSVDEMIDRIFSAPTDSRVQYWNGSGWQKQPTDNQHYVDAKRRANESSNPGQ